MEGKITQLNDALQYLHIGELKEICIKLNLPTKGKKGGVIQRIMVFLKEGKVLKTPEFPEVSLAKKKQTYPLLPSTLILKGSYKNDSATRCFMQSLVGEYFHFTAFGQDWIKNLWLQGRPPTYQEFADYWQEEYEARKKQKARPKKEWAYLNFMQKYQGKEKIEDAWEKERQMQKKIAEKILQKWMTQNASTNT